MKKHSTKSSASKLLLAALALLSVALGTAYPATLNFLDHHQGAVRLLSRILHQMLGG